MHSPARRLREKIRAGHPVLGTFLLEFNSAAAVGVLADAGFDFVMVDCEHGLFSPREIGCLMDAANHANIAGIVRVPSCDRAAITQALDSGAAGILVPAISSLQQVREVVRATKYTPVGKRGVHLLRGHTQHRTVDAAKFISEANQDILTMIQIELEAAVNCVEEIAAAEGVDCLYVGPGDLSVDLGVGGQWNSPPMQRAIQRIASAAIQNGKILACHADRIDDTPRLRDLGVQLFGYFCDIGIFAAAAAGIGREFHNTLRARQ
jgi:2-dehydro-3-deoxyglucarate aldolase/4-hydroxy-2-oxoheptanedioate aldolase